MFLQEEELVAKYGCLDERREAGGGDARARRHVQLGELRAASGEPRYRRVAHRRAAGQVERLQRRAVLGECGHARVGGAASVAPRLFARLSSLT